ncbi:MAG: excinuclease ABC subunit UvrC [Alphaproteobacteria bacterium]|nr:excinuclease ABC subunit UvrC [Alphaproteobacteria bacterium]
MTRDSGYSLTKGVAAIASYIPRLPTSPGVYRMLSHDGTVLYVGKAKNLPKRVVSYTSPERLTYRIQNMIAQTHSMEFVSTKTEGEALLLEANLIKNLQPRYNILLKDDKSFPYIMVTKHEYPQITRHRGKQSSNAFYYGPFASAGDVNRTILTLQRIFLIRPCSDTYFAARKRPCLEYQIKRCSAPCVEKISKDAYGESIKQAMMFLNGKSSEIQRDLAKQMEEASNQFDYEKAAIYRDRIKALTYVQARFDIQAKSIKDADIIGLYRGGSVVAIELFFFRGGQHYGNRTYFPTHAEDAGTEEVLEAFLGQFYQNHPAPSHIYLSHDFASRESFEEALSHLTGSVISITVPKRGDKYHLMETVIENAKQSLGRKMSEHKAQQAILAEVSKRFELPAIPKRIEVYDNSHIMGQYAVGAMIVAGEEGFIKDEYRKFKIRSTELNPGDDYAMLHEVLVRRFSRLKEEDPNRVLGKWPDLVMVDGGAGHLSTAYSVLATLEIDVPLVCIAKGPDRNAGREIFHMIHREPFGMDVHDKVLYYLQQLRDEAHRFGITSHRDMRSKGLTKSVLDNVPGIGPKRKRALLNHFGSIQGIAEALLEDLLKVKGIDHKAAQKIVDYFKH